MRRTPPFSGVAGNPRSRPRTAFGRALLAAILPCVLATWSTEAWAQTVRQSSAPRPSVRVASASALAEPELKPEAERVSSAPGTTAPGTAVPNAIPQGHPIWEEDESAVGPYRDGWTPDWVEPWLNWYSPTQSRLWLRAEYLVGWTQDRNAPPLLSTGPLGSSTVLFDDQNLTESTRSGGRFTLGWWFSPCQCTGLELNFMFLGTDETRFTMSGDGSAGSQVLARPYFDITNGVQEALVIADTGVAGSVNIDATTVFQVGELLFRNTMLKGDAHRVDGLLGYRVARLDDDLRVATSQSFTNFPPFETGTQRTAFDQFDTQNTFHGLELGFSAEVRRCRWTLETSMKMALGNNHSVVDINGGTTTTSRTGTANTVTGGLLAQRTNIGQYTHDQFALMPEIGFMFGYDLTCHLRATCGYTLVYWSRVARAGDQIDVDVSQLVPADPTGAGRPGYSLQTTDFWAQSLNFGLEYRF